MNTSGRVGEGDAQVRLRLTTMVVEGPAAKTKRARRGMMMATMRAVGGRWTLASVELAMEEGRGGGGGLVGEGEGKGSAVPESSRAAR